MENSLVQEFSFNLEYSAKSSDVTEKYLQNALNAQSSHAELGTIPHGSPKLANPEVVCLLVPSEPHSSCHWRVHFVHFSLVKLQHTPPTINPPPQL